MSQAHSSLDPPTLFQPIAGSSHRRTSSKWTERPIQLTQSVAQGAQKESCLKIFSHRMLGPAAQDPFLWSWSGGASGNVPHATGKDSRLMDSCDSKRKPKTSITVFCGVFGQMMARVAKSKLEQHDEVNLSMCARLKPCLLDGVQTQLQSKSPCHVMRLPSSCHCRPSHSRSLQRLRLDFSKCMCLGLPSAVALAQNLPHNLQAGATYHSCSLDLSVCVFVSSLCASFTPFMPSLLQHVPSPTHARCSMGCHHRKNSADTLKGPRAFPP